MRALHPHSAPRLSCCSLLEFEVVPTLLGSTQRLKRCHLLTPLASLQCRWNEEECFTWRVPHALTGSLWKFQVVLLLPKDSVGLASKVCGSYTGGRGWGGGEGRFTVGTCP
jgi:hypothetical protein